MKYAVETEDKLEAEVLIKAKDYYFALWDISQAIRRSIKYDEDCSKEVIEERERMQKEFLDILEEHKIDINLLP